MTDAAMLDTAMIDGTMNVGCPSGYAPIAGSSHRYKTLTNVSWSQAKAMCAATSTAAYLAVHDDATELANLAAAASAPFWVGIDDQATSGMFVTTKGVSATFLPWAPNEPRRCNRGLCRRDLLDPDRDRQVHHDAQRGLRMRAVRNVSLHFIGAPCRGQHQRRSQVALRDQDDRDEEYGDRGERHDVGAGAEGQDGCG